MTLLVGPLENGVERMKECHSSLKILRSYSDVIKYLALEDVFASTSR